MNALNTLFPKTVYKEFNGIKIAAWLFMLLAAVSTIRSLIHLLAPDGGAGTIASLDLSAGAENIVFAFGLWGLSQLIYAAIQLLVAFRYRSLIPLMYVFLIFETLGRMWVGYTKPPIVAHTPPGGIANYIVLPLAAVMLILCFIPSKKEEVKPK